MGIHRALPDAEIIGVDIVNQPRYPFQFRLANAMNYPLEGFDFIWASPPCQAYTMMRYMGKSTGEGAPDLVGPIRERLSSNNTPWVIENVVGSPLKFAALLCGSAFGLGVQRHRVFESTFLVLAPSCRHGNFSPTPVWGDGRPSRQEARKKVRPIAVYGDHPRQSGDKTYRCNRARTLREGQHAMGIDWMEWRELTQAVPPAYSEFILRQWNASAGTAEVKYE
jgi:DNA (cytosine-5)-methyltransferase 1